jgi:hypothetical protein
LCKQVERALSWGLAGDDRSPVLAGAWVAAVEPAPDAARLRVTVVLAPRLGAEDLAPAWAELVRDTPRLRQEVARTIHRKRVPELDWSVKLGGEAPHE